MTVRDGDGSIVQFLYGDDGVDVLKCQYLHDNQFKTVIDNQKVSILRTNLYFLNYLLRQHQRKF